MSSVETNQLLATLPADALSLLSKHVFNVKLSPGDVIAKPGDEMRRVYFPRSGIVSFFIELDEGLIQTAMVGRDGVVGAGQAVDGKVSVNRIVAQTAVTAAVVDRDTLRAAMAQSPDIRKMIAAHEQFLIADIQQTAGCNALHSAKSKMGRWLLRMHDLVGKELPLTQDALAAMIGVRRTTVTIIAGELQSAKIIRYLRGRIWIDDGEQLKRTACGCYQAVREHYETLIGASWPAFHAPIKLFSTDPTDNRAASKTARPLNGRRG